MTVTYYAKAHGEVSPSAALVSSVRIEMSPGHWHLHVYNRGGKAGVLCVNSTDGEKFLDMLLPITERETR